MTTRSRGPAYVLVDFKNASTEPLESDYPPPSTKERLSKIGERLIKHGETNGQPVDRQTGERPVEIGNAPLLDKLAEVHAEVTAASPVPPPDGGWGWMCVLGFVINSMQVVIIIRSFGIIYLEMLKRYDSSPTATSWVGALNMVCSGIFGPIATALAGRFSCRAVSMSGGLICCTGLILTGLSPNIGICTVTYGVIAGVGMCLTYIPGLVAVGDYFEKRKATAMAVAFGGSGIAVLIAPPLMLLIFNEYGFRGSFLILAAISLNGCLGGALYRPLNSSPKQQKRPRAAKLFDCSLFLDAGYVGVFLLILGLMLTVALISGFIPALAMEIGLSPLASKTLLSYMGVADIVGPLTFGRMLDIPRVRQFRVYWLSLCNMLIALTTIVTPFLWNYVGFIVTVVIRGIFMSHLISQVFTVLDDVIDRHRVPSAIGLTLFAQALGAILGRSMAGFITDLLGSYKHGFIIFGSFNMLLSAICMMTYTWSSRKRKLANSMPSTHGKQEIKF